MSRPRLLDLFCGAGGAGMGYHRAGFDVVGVDIKPQPRFPFEFHQGDALTWPLDGFDAVHASPPCQAFSEARTIRGRWHPDLLTPMRARLLAVGVPWWVIENVPRAPMRPDVVLCGSHFGLAVRRHRWFELNWVPPRDQPCCMHIYAAEGPVGVYGHTGTGSARFGRRRAGNHGYTVADWREAMGIDWMTRDQLAQAIPPAYTEWIGAHLIAALRATAVET